MCGIAGFASRSQQGNARPILDRMIGAISHRGPDGSGVYFDDMVALGHRRLSIIDVAGGHQPQPNETKSVWLTYNGEIFNHADIRPELEQLGHRYQTRCDTETIVHGYEQWGPEVLKRFRGMFAFAIWDQSKKTLFCARDRLGIKPFYYYWDGELFAFASEIKALFEHPRISPSFRAAALPEQLAFGYLSSDQTMFEGIRKLMPGHCLRLSFNSEKPQIEITQYWDAPVQESFAQRSDDEWIRDCRTRLEETVRMRLMSDVPLGMFLSGGVDSSAIAALIKRMTSGPVETFAVGYREAEFSELAYASQVAASIGTDHREIVIGMDDFFNALPRMIWHEDEPIAWPSSVSLYYVAKLAAERVKVVLTGEGSDELFAGYERYGHYLFNEKWGRPYQMVPGGVRRMIRGQLAATSLLSANLRRKLLHTFIGREATFESLQLDNFYCAFSAHDQAAYLDSVTPQQVYGNYLGYLAKHSGAPMLNRMLYADIKTYLVELLMKQDQMSMACSIESRVPFLDHTFVEFAASVPPHMKIRGGERKYILKRAVEDILPHDIVYRKKMGFPTPLKRWLLDERSATIYEMLRDKDGLIAGYLDMEAVEGLIQRHLNGTEDATDRLWRLVNLQLWGEMFITGRRKEWADGIFPHQAASVS